MGGDECQGASKLVPSSGTCLCSMQGYMRRIMTLRGRCPPGKRDDQVAKDMLKGSDWLDTRKAWDMWLITQSQGANIKLKKTSKTHEMQLQLDIYKGVPMGKIQHKFQEEYESLAQRHGETKKRDSLNLKEKSQHGNQMKNGI